MRAARETDPERSALEARILEFIGEPDWRRDEARFDRLARHLFALQYARCDAYARFARARGVTPGGVGTWREIPAVPTGAFKEMPLCCFPRAETCKTFRTSGTSGQRRGELHLDTLALYEASLLPTLDHLLFPDLAPAQPRLIRVLAPPADEAPDSSLSHMFEVLVRERGAPGSGFDVKEDRLDVSALVAAIRMAAKRREPVALCGTAFAFVHLLDDLAASHAKLECPPGSRIMETGGFKGSGREMPREALHAALSQRLGIPEARIVNQYGMTELGSQFYDSVQIDPHGPRRKLGPPWARVRLIDPETGLECREGEVGMLVIHDLANTGSVAAIQTADLGRRVVSPSGGPAGFEILGREPGAEARGCSIAADEMLAGDPP
ncbi:MAG: long-chain fatty acid--CoA ligase [Deltaproteobacteria bacterium]|nr:long-chain fatty acid--CoA ligase [Deltaproteobacteria bacterium]MBW2695315.1 long-chain fatty acid--CoA ligase [Deltaproteobacteria bacterium]